jgi:dienelactone hydrolase
MTQLFRLLTVLTVTTVGGGHAHSTIPSISPTGPYSVGRRAVVWTDSSRRDPTDTTRFRDVAAWIWYPAKRTSNEAAETPLPDEWQARRLEALQAKLGPDVARAMQSFKVHSQTDAPVVSGNDRLPVLLFIPGLSWLASDYSTLTEDLASHGYVVVGISPAGFSDPVVFPDGRIVARTLGLGEKIGTDQSYVHDDALFALRKIRQLDDGFLHNRLDLDHIGAFGHSLGGTASLVLADRDTTVRAAVNIDGDAMGDVREARPRQPILLISSDVPTIDEAPQNPSRNMELVRQGLERSEKRRTDEWTAISSQSISAHRIRIPRTYHLNFEDAALASGLVVTSEARWMKFGRIEPEQGLTTLAKIVRSFFDQSFGKSSTNDVCAGLDACLHL